MNNRAIGIMGNNIILRAVEPEDLEMMYIWENDPTSWEHSDTHIPYSRHQLRTFIEGQSQAIGGDGQLRLIICKVAQRQLSAETIHEAAEAIGVVDIFEYSPHHHRAGVGILIDPAHRGKGYATDALLTLENYLSSTLEIHQLWCNISAQNHISLQLFQRCGYAQVGVKRDWIRTRGGYGDEVLFQKVLLVSDKSNETSVGCYPELDSGSKMD